MPYQNAYQKEMYKGNEQSSSLSYKILFTIKHKNPSCMRIYTILLQAGMYTYMHILSL